MAQKTAEKPAAAANPEDEAADLRGTLVKRLAVAGVLVAVLLGVLAFFDYLATPEEPEATVYTKPVPVPPKKEVTQPVKPATDLPDPPKPEGEPPSVPEKTAEPTPAAEAPPKPVVAAQPSAPDNGAPTQASSHPAAQPETKAAPAARPPAPVHETAPTATPVRPPAGPVPEATMAPKVVPQPVAQPVAPAVPSAQVVATKPAEPSPPVKAGEPARPPVLPAPRLFPGYVVQAGVFTNVQRAEELHAKLTLNGIPSTLETRVQIGPFKTKAEADAARDKLQSLGIDSVLIPPPKGAHR